jgi:arylsulfatase A-like enzyme
MTASGFVVAWLVTATIETALLALALTASKSLRLHASRSLRFCGGVLLTLASLAVIIGLAANLTSWYMQSRGLGFLSWGLLRSVLEHPISTLDLTVVRDRALLGFALLLGALLASIVYRAAPAARAWTELRIPAAFTIAATLLLLTGLHFGLGSQRLIAHQLSPNATLLWGHAFSTAQASSTRWTAILDAAERRQDLATYRQLAASHAPPSQARPNILVIAVESLRAGEAHSIINGRPVMPTLTAQLPSSVVFTQAYAQGNETAYSIPSLVTGLHALKGIGRDSFDWNFPYTHIYDLLSPIYRCAYFSSADESWQGMSSITTSTFLSKYLDASHHTGNVLAPDAGDTAVWRSIEAGRAINGGLDDAVTANEFLSWQATTAKDNPSQPFFAFVNFQTSHYPYEMGVNVPKPFQPSELTPTEKAASSFFDYPERLAPTMRNRYRNSLAYIDSQIARLLSTLERQNTLGNTIVIVVGDHGQMFHEHGAVTHGQRLFAKALHVHFQAWGPLPWKSGNYAEPVGLLDLAPMLLQAANLPPFEGFQGQVPLQLSAQSIPTPTPVFSTTRGFSTEDSVRVGRWKYVRHSGNAYESLHDLISDPEEHTNRIAHQPQVAACLSAALEAYSEMQILYYQQAKYREERVPPRHRLPATPDCAAAFPSARLRSQSTPHPNGQ